MPNSGYARDYKEKIFEYICYSAAIASLLIAAALLAGAFATAAGILNLNFIQGSLAFFGRNWIILFLKLNAGLAGWDAVKIYQPVDIVLIILFAIMFTGIFASLGKKNVAWRIFSIWALLSPLLGLIILLKTNTAGRTGLLTGSLIYSILMLLSGKFKKATAVVGIISSLTILVAVDIITGKFLSVITALFIGAGYILWILWFFLVAREFFYRGVSPEEK